MYSLKELFSMEKHVIVGHPIISMFSMLKPDPQYEAVQYANRNYHPTSYSAVRKQQRYSGEKIELQG